jgi:hexosaminidase
VRARGWVAFAAIAVVAAGTITGWMLMRDDDDKAQPLAGVVPAPVQVTPGQGQFTPSGGTTVTGEDGGAVADYLISVLPSLGPVVLMIADGHGDEGYELDVTSDRITLTASHPAGLFHGVQTLRQLVTATGTIPVQRIVDQPRFAYRGVMLDVARHFFDVETVKHVIDLAALFKLNHLHLHLTDDQGWRIAVPQWPRLTEYGGGTEVGGGPGGSYTRADYQEIVAYAASRFMTVVPEVDLPGHTNAALASYPELTCDGQPVERYTGMDVGFSSLCAGNEKTYQFLDDVFGALAELTPGPYLHIGGDEAKTLGPEDYATIVERAQDIVAKHGKTVVGYHELAEATLLPSTVLQYWGTTPDAPAVAAAARRGNTVILSPANHAYLDMKYSPSTRLGLSWAGYIPVEEAYNWEPGLYLSGVDTSAVLGLEAPLWTETVRTLEDIEYLMLPRLAVLAELGWTDHKRGFDDLSGRLRGQEPLWSSLGLAWFKEF